MNWRKILFPFSVLYDGITRLRNYLYDKGIFESTAYSLPVICVGNLNVGGTGKTPMIEFLISILKDDFDTAVLSRGYKRKTKGFYEVKISDSAVEAGDEPLQFKRKFPEITVAVDANRRKGIAKLKEKANVILLDDAFQHRKVKPYFSILLTTYNDLYTDDLLLPAGNLRESKKGAKRADCIVVTKCLPQLSVSEQNRIIKKLKPKISQEVYFTTIAYSQNIYGKEEIKELNFLQDKKFTLVTGIANPKPMVSYLKENGFDFEHLQFADHHHFSAIEIAILNKKQWILTTEKDYMRLDSKIKSSLFYLPVKTCFIEKEDDFIQQVRAAVNDFTLPKRKS